MCSARRGEFSLFSITFKDGDVESARHWYLASGSFGFLSLCVIGLLIGVSTLFVDLRLGSDSRSSSWDDFVPWGG